jgi:CheY-like chemotaxis protein
MRSGGFLLRSQAARSVQQVLSQAKATTIQCRRQPASHLERLRPGPGQQNDQHAVRYADSNRRSYYSSQKRTDGEIAHIFAVTANGFEKECQALLEAGFDQVLHEPYRQERLEEILAGYRFQNMNKTGAGIASAHLRQLPPELVCSLKQTARLADAQAVDEIITRIVEKDSETAAHPKACSEAYRFELIENFLKA